MLFDEGINLNVGEDRWVDVFCVEPQVQQFDKKTGDFICNFQTNIHPDSLAQVAARNRNGKQTTYVIGTFGEQEAINYKEEVKAIEEKYKGNNTRILNKLAKLDSNRANLNQDDYKRECLELHVELNVEYIDMPKAKDFTNQRDSELRTYISNTSYWANYSSVLDPTWIKTNDVPEGMSLSLTNEVRDVALAEIDAWQLGIHPNLYIGEFYNKELRDALRAGFKAMDKEPETTLGRIVKQIMKLETQKLDLTGWGKLITEEQSVVKKLINYFYKCNRVFTHKTKRKSVVLKDFDNELPEFVKENIRKKEQLKYQNHEFEIIRATNNNQLRLL